MQPSIESDHLTLLWATPLLVRCFAGVEVLHEGREQAKLTTMLISLSEA